jgi:excisionase family DNA binding protein
MNKTILWPHEVAAESGVSTATVRRMADSGRIEFIRDAKGRRRFPVRAVEQARRALGISQAWKQETASLKTLPAGLAEDDNER